MVILPNILLGMIVLADIVFGRMVVLPNIVLGVILLADIVFGRMVYYLISCLA